MKLILRPISLGRSGAEPPSRAPALTGPNAPAYAAGQMPAPGNAQPHGPAKFYLVLSPDMTYVEPVLDDGSGPRIPFRCAVSVRANSQREAIAKAIRLPDFKEWLDECRSDGRNPFFGVKAEDHTCGFIDDLIKAVDELRKFSKHDHGCSLVVNNSWCDCGCEEACIMADDILNIAQATQP